MSGVLLRARLFLVLARPPLLLLLAMSGALGAASAGAALEVWPTLRAFLVVVPCLVYAVSLNDLADVRVDRINLAGDPARPLVGDPSRAGDVRVVAAAAATVALLVAATVGRDAVLVTGAGLLVSTAYSVPPLALNRRGVLGPLVLPLCLLAVPFGVGVLAAGGDWGAEQTALLAALYAGFVGRLLVKDFRDVRGDALLGKRTFLVRHGRRATCALSGLLWLLGSVALLAVPAPTWSLALCWTALVVTALGVLAALARRSDHHRDERLVAALAITGRALVLLLLLHLALVEKGTQPVVAALLLVAVTAGLVLSAVDVARHGPRRSRTAAPSELEATA